MSPAKTASRTVNVASRPCAGIPRSSSRYPSPSATQPTPSTSGRPMTATTTRDPSPLRARSLAAAEATPSARIVLERGAEIVAAEVGPDLVHEHELRVSGLPEQEVRDP